MIKSLKYISQLFLIVVISIVIFIITFDQIDKTFWINMYLLNSIMFLTFFGFYLIAKDIQKNS